MKNDPIFPSLLNGENSDLIRYRYSRNKTEQKNRTRQKAEVFTPSWVCNLMNNLCDEEWFGRKDVFNHTVGKEWQSIKNPVSFEGVKHKSRKPLWQKYIDIKILEITCGEAPFIVSRYDASTGISIPLSERIGLLDRKLRIVSENCKTEEEWQKWAKRAFESTYGYEYQGDSLLLARENLLLSYAEYFIHSFNKPPARKKLKEIAKIIAWNLWQMDGLTDATFAISSEKNQYDFFETLNLTPFIKTPSHICDWRSKRNLCFKNLKEGEKTMKFDFVIGNPPYQEENNGNGNGSNNLYHFFIDSSQTISNQSILIHPAKFLFNAGKTPKVWNMKMLNNEHFKIIKYFPNSNDVFPKVNLEGGIAISFWNKTKIFGKIGTFVTLNELNSILNKVLKKQNFEPFSNFVYPNNLYSFTNDLYTENQWALERQSKGHKYSIGSNIFYVTLPEIFHDEKPNNTDIYIQLYGMKNKKNERCLKWVKKKYIKTPDNFEKFKIFIPKANGSGAIGEVSSTIVIGKPIIGKPMVGHTDTFLSIGNFSSELYAEYCLKYLKTKFTRLMLGTLKVTQDNPSYKWKNVPLQDFTEKSDIDWSKSIHEIDLQLYKKYDLTEEEISFIETHVKEMA